MFLKLPPKVKDFLGSIEAAVSALQEWDEEAPHVRAGDRGRKNFTADGRMIGDIGEVLAERYFAIKLKKNQEAGCDAVLEKDDKTKVEIKITRHGVFQFRKIPDRVIALSLVGNADEVEVVFNGPGSVLVERVSSLRGNLKGEKTDHWTLGKAVNVKPGDIRGLVGTNEPKRVPLRPGIKAKYRAE